MCKTLSTIALLGLATIAAAYAQLRQPIQANVPFALAIHNATLVTGASRLASSNVAHVFSIRALDVNAVGALNIPSLADAFEFWGGPSRLVFDCYGESCNVNQARQGADYGGARQQLPENNPQRLISVFAHTVSVAFSEKSSE